jgi:membrane associated rhomboid family serine protease
MTQFRPSRFEILPPIIKNLLIINGLFFLAQNTLTGPDIHFSFDDTFALHAWQSSLFKPWQLVTHLFLHGSITHILFNMLALWMFGSVLENIWGSKRFLAFYLVCGLGAALIHLLFLSYEFMPMLKDYNLIFQLHSEGADSQGVAMANFISKYHIEFNEEGQNLLSSLRSGTNDPFVNMAIYRNITAFYQNSLNTATIGASGAVFGVLAAFGYLFPNTQIYVYFLIPVKAKWFVLFYGAIELYEGVKNSAGDNVAHWAHIGGAIVGLLIVITWNKNNKKTFY